MDETVVSFHYQGYWLLTIIFYTCSIFLLLFHTNIMGSFKSGERVTIFGEQESRRGREEVVSYTALFFSGFRVV